VPLKVSEIIKMIEADGWYLVATRGTRHGAQHP
jgi:predicted RNA binding protein YcfA (HicA-like mRNA interferase family)